MPKIPGESFGQLRAWQRQLRSKADQESALERDREKLGMIRDDHGYWIDRTFEEYQRMLPQFPSEWLDAAAEPAATSFFRVMAKRLEQVIEAGRNTTVNILDLGCGNGRALSDLFLKFTDHYGQQATRRHLRLVGLSLTDLRNYPGIESQHGNLVDIADYIVGDMQDVLPLMQANSYPAGTFTGVMSNHALMYTEPAYMRRHVVKQVYALLADQGMAALACTRLVPDWKKADAAVAKINHQIQSHGSLIRLGLNEYKWVSVVMKKNNQPFYLPLHYDAKGHSTDLQDVNQ